MRAFKRVLRLPLNQHVFFPVLCLTRKSVKDTTVSSVYVVDDYIITWSYHSAHLLLRRHQLFLRFSSASCSKLTTSWWASPFFFGYSNWNSENLILEGHSMQLIDELKTPCLTLLILKKGQRLLCLKYLHVPYLS